MREQSGALSVADRVVGVYQHRGVAAATFHCLTLTLDGEFTFDDWSDMRGRWDREASGAYSVEATTVHLHRDSPSAFELVQGPLAIRGLQGRMVLVPQRYLSEFDETGGAGHPWRAAAAPFADGFGLFVKDPLPRAVVCSEPAVYAHALTRGKRYLVVEERDFGTRVRLFGDHGRLRWFPAACFEFPTESGNGSAVPN